MHYQKPVSGAALTCYPAPWAWKCPSPLTIFKLCQYDATGNSNVTAYNPLSKSLLASHLPFAKPKPHVSQMSQCSVIELGLGWAKAHPRKAASFIMMPQKQPGASSIQAARRRPCHVNDPLSETDYTCHELNGTAPRHSEYPVHPTRHRLAHRLTYTLQSRGQKNKECENLEHTQYDSAHTNPFC
jgi:hypothetical protein